MGNRESEIAGAWRGYLMVGAAAVMWSVGGMFVKVLRGHYGMAPQAIACLRSGIGGLALAWALPRLGGAPLARAAGATVAFTVVVFTYVMAMVGTTAANAVFLQYAHPLIVAVGAVWLFRERLGARTVAALALGMAGVATILVGSWTAGQQAGLLYGVVSAFAFATLTLVQRSMRKGNPVALASLYNVAGGLLMVPLALGHFAISLEATVVVGLMGVFQLAVPYVLFIQGLKTVRATDAAIITLVEPILNPVWVWLAVGERPVAATLIGAALILIALIVRFTSAPAGGRPQPERPVRQAQGRQGAAR